MEEVADQDRAERLASGDDVCSTTVLMPATMRQDLEQAARAHERSLGGEVRAALRQWLDDEPVLPWR